MTVTASGRYELLRSELVHSVQTLWFLAYAIIYAALYGCELQ